MDPITVVGFLAAVVQLIDVTSKAVIYFNDVKNAPKERAKLAREATNLLSLFTELRYRVEETAATDPWFAGLRSLGGQGGPLMEFKDAMDAIADKLVPPKSGVNLRVLRWTLEKKEIEAILWKIDRLKALVGLALQSDHFKLSLAMKEEMTVEFQEIKINRDLEKINQWFSAPLPSSNHNTAMKKRQPSTGEWFTRSKEFSDWKIGTKSFIWLHGIPGCGKTVLCSTIIQDVISNFKSQPAMAVAYFYFDFNDLDKLRTEKLIRSLIVQIAAQCPHLPEPLQSAYTRSRSGQEQPTVEDMEEILREILQNFRSVYILLDALDECTDREDLLEFIEALMGWNINNFHLLATSRKENDIAKFLEPLVTCQLGIQSALVDADIRVHIVERLSNDPHLKKWPADVQKEIEDTIIRDANGMFRWAICQLESLRKCLKLATLRRTLNTLPKTLDETYERILSNIDQEYQEDALKIFQWLCFSDRPIRLDEMVEVLATDSNIDSHSDFGFKPEQRLPDPCDILTICSTLVSATAASNEHISTQMIKSQELRLAHFSVKEYLISDRLKVSSMHRYHITPSSASFSIAKTCLTYLLYFESPTTLVTELDQEFPLIKYAAYSWPWHYRSITNDADREVVDFLGYNLAETKKSCFANWLEIFDPETRDVGAKSDIELEIYRSTTPLYYMSSLGVSGVLKMLLDKGANIGAKGRDWSDALSAASYGGYKEAVQVLLANGANVNAKGHPFYGHALLGASWGGNVEVVRLLLEHGANINAEGDYGNALSAASRSGHEKVVRLLLEHGANVNARNGYYGDALSAASLSGNEKVVRLLLEHGANINAEDGCYGDALSAASQSGHEKVVRMLLEHGANINAEGGDYGNALSAASLKGREKVVQLLLEKGANINAGDGFYGDALSAASLSGHEKVVRLLLEHGANINAEGGHYGNALSAASLNGHEQVVRLLLENGANVNAQSGLFNNALSSASGNGHEKVVHLLLDKGADVNAHSGHALEQTIITGQHAVTRLLLENGADIDLVFKDPDERLQGVSLDDYETLTEVLQTQHRSR